MSGAESGSSGRCVKNFNSLPKTSFVLIISLLFRMSFGACELVLKVFVGSGGSCCAAVFAAETVSV